MEEQKKQKKRSNINNNIDIMPTDEICTGSSLDLSIQSEADALNKIFAILLQKEGVEFSGYRQTTVTRRLCRRMNMAKAASIKQYLDFFKDSSTEQYALYRDLLLSFTMFFRDPRIFSNLKKNIFPRLALDRSAKSPIRIWVPGCSTGEEVYSLAIALHEYLEESKSNAKIQFFGTDLVESNIVAARSAIYSEKITVQVSQERLKGFFDKEHNSYRVTKHIREMCVFATQDLTKDPPFSNIDLISCRNVLIYFSESFQDIIFPLFHFALRPSGILVLGSSETINRTPELFSCIDPKDNIFIKHGTSNLPVRKFSFNNPIQRNRISPILEENTTIYNNEKSASVLKIAQHAILESYAPPGVLIDHCMRILHFIGETHPFVSPSSGEASLKLSKMANEALMPDLYVALEEAKKSNSSVYKQNIQIKQQDKIINLNIKIIPLLDPIEQLKNYLVLFEKQIPTSASTYIPSDTKTDEEIKLLRQELHLTRNHLQAIIEEKDEVNLELWAANEEVQSTNEELQSVNEEMEAAKEELESSNEELLALNEELQLKNLELNSANITLETSIAQSPSGIILINAPDITIKMANSAAQKITGGKPDLLIGIDYKAQNPNWQISYPDKTPCPYEKLPLSLAISEGITTYNEELLITDNNNLEHWISANAAPIFGAKNQITGGILIFQNITENKKTEYQLKEREKTLRELFENMSDGFALHKIITDLSGKPIDYEFTQVNKVFANRVGTTPEKLTGKTALELFPETEQYWIDIFSKVSNTSEPAIYTNYSTELDKHYEAHLYCPKPGFCAGIFTDITARVKAERARIESENTLRSYVENAPEGLFVSNEKGILIDVNLASCKITQYSKDELIGMNYSKLLIPEESGKITKHIHTVKIEGEAKEEFQFIKKNKDKGYWHIITVKLSETRFLSFTRDITEDKILQTQFHQSEKMRAIGQLAGGIAHDFNNQLSGILGFSDLLREEVSGQQRATRFVENIFTGVKRASALTSQLLAFSRKGKYLEIALDIHHIIEELAAILSHSLDKKIQIKTSFKAEASTIKGDPSQIQNAFLNLALNAKDAMPQGGTILFSTQNITINDTNSLKEALPLLAGEYILINVTDSGYGMNEEIKTRIFEPFFTTKEQGKGVGMGLAATYGTIKNHRGSIKVKTKQGQGTTFIIHLPLEKTISDLPLNNLAPSYIEQKQTSAKILFVDDEESIREVVQTMLEALGYQVTVCKNGLLSLEYYRENWKSIDVVILDMVMPVMGGKQAFVEMKKINPDIVAIVASGYSLEDDAREMLKQGIKGFIQKPFRKMSLAKTIMDSMNKN